MQLRKSGTRVFRCSYGVLKLRCYQQDVCVVATGKGVVTDKQQERSDFLEKHTNAREVLRVSDARADVLL